jgi:hypothetical protein
MQEIYPSEFTPAQQTAHCALIRGKAAINITADHGNTHRLIIDGVSFGSYDIYTDAANHLIALANVN